MHVPCSSWRVSSRQLLQQLCLDVCHLQLAGVAAVHDLHVWTLKPGVVMLSAHIIATGDVHLLLRNVEGYCKQHGIHHPTVQIEHQHHSVMYDEDVALIPSHHSVV